MAPKRGGGRGKLSRRAALALVGGGGLLAVSGTGAFDTVSGDREFDVSTTDDPNTAVLGITELRDRFAQLVSSTSSEPLLKLINNQSESLVEIKITAYKYDSFGNKSEYQGLTIDSVDEIPGSSGNNEAVVTGEITKPGVENITLEIFASSVAESGSGISVETSKEIVVAGYKTQSCPTTAASTTLDGDYDSSSDVRITNERVLGSVRASRIIDIKARGSGGTILIDGAVTAEGAGKSKISANANDSAVYIGGDVVVSADDGDLVIKGKDITIGGDVTVEGSLTVHANGSNANITICGTAEPDKIKAQANGATVKINGEERSGESEEDEEGEEGEE